MEFATIGPLAQVWNALGGDAVITVRLPALEYYISRGARIVTLNESVSGGYKTTVEYGEWRYAAVSYHPLSILTWKGSS
jgi:hypothetical protein